MDFNDILHDREIHLIEEEIIRQDTQSPPDNYTCRSLLTMRKEIINDRVMEYKEEILPDVIAFNDALTKALRNMYDKAHEVWNNIKDNKCFDEDLVLKAECDLSHERTIRELMNGSHEDKLWCALVDTSTNYRYHYGVTLKPLILPFDNDKTFEELMDMDYPQFHDKGDFFLWEYSKWRYKLAKGVTEELHLSSAFYNLLYNMCFAITDFIYVRRFATHISIDFSNELLY